MSAKNKRASDDPRGNLFLGDPDKLTVIDDPAHPLYQKRVLKPLTEEFIRHIDVNGYIQPIVVRKEGDQFIVTAGRRRVRAGREINKRRRAEGVAPIRVPYVVRRSDTKTAVSIMIGENAHRMNDDLVAQAEEAQHALDQGIPEEQVASDFGIGVPALKMRLKLLECSTKVQSAVVEERVTLTDAVKRLSGLPHTQQESELEKLAVERPTRAARKKNGTGKRGNGTSPGARVTVLFKNRELLGEKPGVLIAYIKGEASKGDLLEAYPRLKPALEG